MKIELYSARKLSSKGSALQSMIQNKDKPILDLLVRESIQNSLDARDLSSRSQYVDVAFNIDSFDVKTLDKELEGISLKDREEWGSRYLSISDKHTVGLTGKYDDKSDNLYKLVFGIMEAQQTPGAGGAWGIGKTVYFRVGVGMVVYYSRVKKGDGFSSLMTVAFVEDETSKNAILPPVKGQKYGIAWWGDKVSPRSPEIKETRKQAAINRVLSAFKIKPYVGNDTGTIIIIPFINEEHLLKHNQPLYEDGIRPFWMSSVEDYLRIATQKWYSARLNNRQYPYGKALRVSICGKSITQDNMEPFFRVTQQLYNKAALSASNPEEAQSIQIEGSEAGCSEIRVNSEISPKIAGYVAFAKFGRAQIGMTAPDNCPSPYEYIFSSVNEEDYGKPIVLFSRQPGMVVSYETEGNWVNSIPNSSEDDYIVAWFVLNPTPKLLQTEDNFPLEEYVRKSEMADHFSWNDYAFNGAKPRIITKIKSSVAKKVASSFENVPEDQEKREDMGLGNLLGRFLLPPEGFGRRPSAPSSREPGANTEMRKGMKYKYSILEYTPSGIKLQVHVSSGKSCVQGFGFSLEMETISGAMNAMSWETETELPMPFYIDNVYMRQNIIDESFVGTEHNIEKGNHSTLDALEAICRISTFEDWYGVGFRFKDGEKHSMDLSLIIDIVIRRKDIKPSISFE